MESNVAEFSSLDRVLVVFLLALTLVGPVLVIITMVFSKTFQRTDGGKVVLAVGVAGFAACTVGWQSEILGGQDPFNGVINTYLVPLMSLVCLGSLLFGARAIGQMGRDGANFKVRLMSFWVMFVMIPMGFAPVARLIDGDHGLDSTMQYFAEYLWRLADMISFGHLSSFDRAGYGQIVVYTAEHSYSVVLFNFIVGFFVLSSLVKLVRPDFSMWNRTDKSANPN